MDRAKYIVEAGNTVFPCLFVIKQKGYTIKAVSDNDDYTLFATKGDLTFISKTEAGLLGLITMYEARGDTWAQWSEEDHVSYSKNLWMNEHEFR